MKVFYGIGFLVVFLSVLLSCETPQKREERLAKQYCGSCHTFPDPGLLDKNTWGKGVFPQMAFRMGIDHSMLFMMSQAEQNELLNIIPARPMMEEDEWKAIQNYYLTNAPDSLIASTPIITDTIEQFDIKRFRLPNKDLPLLTLVSADTLNNKIYLGNRHGKLYKLDEKFKMLDSFQLSSPASKVIVHKNEDPLLLLMGIMDPNDQPRGKLMQLRVSNQTAKLLIDSLKRPVYFEVADLNGDNLQDYVICAFGNYSGALLAYENQSDGKFRKHTIQSLPGARKIIFKDFNKDGKLDILALMSQGDKKIILLYNQGNFNFSTTTLLRFPPVYGSSYFDIADFNNDGKFDILYTNGDNADYSIMLKPYHGVRVFLNDGKNEFHESWFYNMHGASQAVVHDFDKDGDLDIAAISFFPDFKTQPEQGFIYFKNTGKDFIPQITPLGSSGRWLTMDAVDFDRDGDQDILLGALDFSSLVPAELSNRWSKEKTSVLILQNKLK